MHWRLGYHRGFAIGANTRNAFGHYGFGGSGALCDPNRQLAVAMTVTSLLFMCGMERYSENQACPQK